MKRAAFGTLILSMALGLVACDDDDIVFYDDDYAAPPENLEAWYYDRAVYITWELSPDWNNDPFRVYGKRVTDGSYFFIAEVTNCSGGLCSYTDVNIVSNVSYEYYVASVSPGGYETASEWAVEVFVPAPDPPADPTGVEVVALDNANFIRWGDNARNATDFSFYRVYLDEGGGEVFFLGETDSEGFLDLLAFNGETSDYFVTSVDDQGHESTGSSLASGTPRPDYHGEWIYAYADVPGSAGFRFTQDELTYPIVDGDSPDRHFRVEVDAQGWWLVPGPGTQIYDGLFDTTALKCGVDSDSDCVSLDEAPLSGYTSLDMALYPQTTYALKVQGDDGQTHFGAVRVTLLGTDQEGSAIMIFDWAYQLQAGNPNLAPREAVGR